MSKKLTLSVAVLLCSVSAHAQAGPATEKSAEQITCELTGDCGPAAEATRGEGPSRGFSIRRQAASGVSTPPPAAAVAQSKSLVRSRPAPAAGYVAHATSRPAQVGHSSLTVGFALGSAVLDDQGKGQAAKLLDALRGPSLAGKKVLVSGHTDSSGTREHNLDLSQRRADSLVNYLVQNGIDRSLLEAHGYGFDKPLPNTSAASPSNRRVEISLAS